jgi:predicted transcriptional regulator
MRVLLSIRPEYVEKIFEGEKKFEFRRSIFKDPDVRRVVVYASSPVKLVVGEFEVADVIHGSVETLWKKTRHSAGISKDGFFHYFFDKSEGYAIQIGKVRQYKRPLSLVDTYGLIPPQSFAYLHQKSHSIK